MFLETPRLARACFAFTEKRSMLTLHLCHQSTAWTLKSDREVREVVKKRIFYGQADCKGGKGGSAPLALTVSNCEHFDPFLTFEI